MNWLWLPALGLLAAGIGLIVVTAGHSRKTAARRQRTEQSEAHND